jgi:hypothetical protein
MDDPGKVAGRKSSSGTCGNLSGGIVECARKFIPALKH